LTKFLNNINRIFL